MCLIEYPHRARQVESNRPTGPAPTMTMSYLLDVDVDVEGDDDPPRTTSRGSMLLSMTLKIQQRGETLLGRSNPKDSKTRFEKYKEVALTHW